MAVNGSGSHASIVARLLKLERDGAGGGDPGAECRFIFAKSQRTAWGMLLVVCNSKRSINPVSAFALRCAPA